MKRLFDLTASVFGVVILLPLFLLVSALIAIMMGFPIIFKQKRVGRNEVIFEIYKFRTMVTDAPKLGPSFTTGGDPRITPLGKKLRRYKIDELPQLFNIMKGDMSLVGPRPEVPEFVGYYNAEQKQVLSVRPGLTDPASIIYHDEETILTRYDDAQKAYLEKIMPAKLKLNLAYIKKSSFPSDLGLIFKTISRLFSLI